MLVNNFCYRCRELWVLTMEQLLIGIEMIDSTSNQVLIDINDGLQRIVSNCTRDTAVGNSDVE